MDGELMIVVEMFVLGILVGLISSILGLGGGIVIVPALTVYFALSQHEAIATSLFTIVFVTLINTWRFHRQQLVDWKTVMQIVIYSSAASFLSGILASLIQEDILLSIFILFLVYMSVSTFRLKHRHQKSTAENCLKWPDALKIGGISGIIAGVTGIGGGGITTPMLLSSGCMSSERVVPNSNAIMIFTTSFSSIAFMITPNTAGKVAQIGYVHADLAFLIFISAMPAALAGTHLQKFVPITWRKNLLASFLLIICIRLLIKLLN